MPEEFDAVVFVGIVRSGKNDAGIGAQRARDVGDTGRRQRTDDKNIDTERSDPGDERILKHVTGKARVFAQHNFGARTFRNGARIQLRENMRGGAAEFQRSLSGDWLDIGDAADAVSAENSFCLRHVIMETLEGDS